MIEPEMLAGLATRVTVAARLWSRTAELIRVERALFSLQGCFPRFDAESTLLKVVALHSLDASRAFPVTRWAAHVEALLAGADVRAFGLELVDSLAALPGGERRRALAFASRFAHYFVDADRFPVLDAWTQAELARYAPPCGRAPSLYVDFAARHGQLAAAAGIARAWRLGSYLWLAGQYRAWSRNPRTSIQRAARALFESGHPDLLWRASYDDPREAHSAA